MSDNKEPPLKIVIKKRIFPERYNLDDDSSDEDKTEDKTEENKDNRDPNIALPKDQYIQEMIKKRNS